MGSGSTTGDLFLRDVGVGGGGGQPNQDSNNVVGKKIG